MKERLYALGRKGKTIYGYGIFFCLFLGGGSALVYLAAFALGGEAAASICAFMHERFFPVLIYATNAFVLLGLLSMYLCGEKSMSREKE